MSQTVKCAWCGALVPLTAKGRPRQHRNGTRINIEFVKA